jgi:hypothetical protein
MVSDPVGGDAWVDGCTNNSVVLAVARAVDDGAEIVSLSVGATLDRTVSETGAWALSRGVVIVASLPNEQTDVDAGASELASYSGVVAVGSVDVEGNRPVDTQTGVPVVYPRIVVRAPGVGLTLTSTDSWDETRTGGGTSLATPITSGALALLLQRFPDASANQVVQALLLSASGGGQPSPDYGWGAIDIEAALAMDVMALPDENVLLGDSPAWDGDITAADVRAAKRPSFLPEPSPSPGSTATDALVSASPGGEQPPAAERSSGGVVVWVAVGVVVVVALAVVAIVVVRRRRLGAGSRVGADRPGQGGPGREVSQEGKKEGGLR